MTEENDEVRGFLINPLNPQFKPRAGEWEKVQQQLRKYAEGIREDWSRNVAVTASDLNLQLENLQRQVAALQASDHATKEQIEELASTAGRVADKGEELMARVLLPRPEHMAVPFVPSHSLERLEEYRSDRSIALLLFGLFGGAVLGILSNWATAEQFIITRFSGVLIGLLGVLAVGSIIWAWRISRRIAPIKKQMLRPAQQPTQPKAPEKPGE